MTRRAQKPGQRAGSNSSVAKIKGVRSEDTTRWSVRAVRKTWLKSLRVYAATNGLSITDALDAVLEQGLHALGAPAPKRYVPTPDLPEPIIDDMPQDTDRGLQGAYDIVPDPDAVDEEPSDPEFVKPAVIASNGHRAGMGRCSVCSREMPKEVIPLHEKRCYMVRFGREKRA